MKIKNLNSSAIIMPGGQDAPSHIWLGPRVSSQLKDNVMSSLDDKTKGAILRAMATFTAIELYGSFITGQTGQNTTKLNFNAFCESKYMPSEYNKIKDLLYDLFRNGIAHSYVPKGAAYLSENSSEADFHLNFLNTGLFIHVPTFAKDVVGAIKNFYEDFKVNQQLKINYQRILQNLDTYGRKKYHEFIQNNNISVSNIKIKRGIGVDKELFYPNL